MIRPLPKDSNFERRNFISSSLTEYGDADRNFDRKCKIIARPHPTFGNAPKFERTVKPVPPRPIIVFKLAAVPIKSIIVWNIMIPMEMNF